MGSWMAEKRYFGTLMFKILHILLFVSFPKQINLRYICKSNLIPKGIVQAFSDRIRILYVGWLADYINVVCEDAVPLASL